MYRFFQRRFRTLLIISFMGYGSLFAQHTRLPPFFQADWSWVDSVFQSMSDTERIAQLIMVPAWSNRGPEHEQEIEHLIRRYGIGGVCFFQGGPVRQVRMVNRFQAAARIPLLVAMDAEWGLKMRLDSTTRFPYQMALGALQDDQLISRMGREIGRQLKLVGVQMNFAPVLDVNNNPANPVINYRSFGADPELVARKGIAYMKGMQEERILATGKHFPGHGDTDTDSHLALPLISHSRAHLNRIELLPFNLAVDRGISSIMIAHLQVPAFEDSIGIPTTLSARAIQGVLQGTLHFRGLKVTDALNMKGVTGIYPPGELEVRALQAGNDMLVYVEDVPLTIRSIRKALADGRLLPMDIETHCKLILAAKYWAGLTTWKPLSEDHLVEKLNSPVDDALAWELTRGSLTVLRNSEELIPVKHLDSLKIAVVSTGTGKPTVFENRIRQYTTVSAFHIPNGDLPGKEQELLSDLTDYDLVIVGVHDTDQRPARRFGVSPGLSSFLLKLIRQNRTIVSYFGNPYALQYLPGIEEADGLLVTYQESELTKDLAAQLIFGGISASGKLPVSVGSLFPAGSGVSTDGDVRLSFAPAGVVGIDEPAVKKKIDSICLNGIAVGAYPGCEVLCARNGRVFFQECYGYHTYDSIIPVKPADLYDLASVTKVSGPLPLIMDLYQEDKLDLDQPMWHYWPDFRVRAKRDMTVREVLAHYGRLKAWIPFWKDTKRVNGKFKWHTFHKDSSAAYPIRVSEHLWIYRNYARKIYRSIRQSPVNEKREYVYSDLSFYLWPKIIERLSGEDYQQRLQRKFYRPMGIENMMYDPRRKYSLDDIVPTERDTFFRMELIHGYVHDEGAAMLGGVSGHAGLFSTALDLAKLWQMYLWKGFYGGKEFIDPMVVNEFSSYQYASDSVRRGLGFDKPLIGNATLPHDETYPTYGCSASSFGHSGFTGTFVWVDPENGLLYVFLSNRVYPTRDNSKLYDMNIRTKILQILYD
ncbi:MAG: serine hydrolase, partial [Bacteroidales bacterium]|nr:serine hydrolase [Bacteroidales bacterium]